uniref:Putative bunyavirus glycoprotein n=1 Tax=Soybean thrips bunya-like virus 5 TaxID=2796575 RepID=A0A7T3R0N4_9VIRU|nr:putative bunyavirus glycoprotein precursor [Soybean thrips bunya-like virus 5]
MRRRSILLFTILMATYFEGSQFLPLKNERIFESYSKTVKYTVKNFTEGASNNYLVGIDEETAKVEMTEYMPLLEAVFLFLKEEPCKRELIILGNSTSNTGWSFGIVLGEDNGINWGLIYDKFDGFSGLTKQCNMPCERGDFEGLISYSYCILSNEARRRRSAFQGGVPEQYNTYEMVEDVNHRSISKEGAKDLKAKIDQTKKAIKNMNESLNNAIDQAKKSLEGSLITNLQFLAGKIEAEDRNQGQKIKHLTNEFYKLKNEMKTSSQNLQAILNSPNSHPDEVRTALNKMIDAQSELLNKIDNARFGIQELAARVELDRDGEDLCSKEDYRLTHPCSCSVGAVDVRVSPVSLREGFGIAKMTCRIGDASKAELSFRDYTQKSNFKDWGENSYKVGNDILEHQRKKVEAWKDLGKPSKYPCEIICLGASSIHKQDLFVNHYYLDSENKPKSEKLYYEEICQCVPNTFSCKISISDLTTEVRVSLRAISGTYRVTYDGQTTNGFVVGSEELVFKQPESGKKLMSVECNMEKKELLLMHSLKDYCNARWKGEYMMPMRLYCKNSEILWISCYLTMGGLSIISLHKQIAQILSLVLSPVLATFQALFLTFVTCNVCRAFRIRKKGHVHLQRCIFCGDTKFYDNLLNKSELMVAKAFRLHRLTQCVMFRRTNRLITATLSSFNFLKFLALIFVKPTGFLLIFLSVLLLAGKTDAFDKSKIHAPNKTSIFVKVAMKSKAGDQWTMESSSHAPSENGSVNGSIMESICSNYLQRTSLMLTMSIISYLVFLLLVVVLKLASYCSICHKVNAKKITNRMGYKILLCRDCSEQRVGLRMLSEFYRDDLAATSIYRPTVIPIGLDDFSSEDENTIYENVVEMKDKKDTDKDSSKTDASDLDKVSSKCQTEAGVNRSFINFKKRTHTKKKEKKKENIKMESLSKMNECYEKTKFIGQLLIGYKSFSRILVMLIVASLLFKPTFCGEISKDKHGTKIIENFLKDLVETGFQPDPDVMFHKLDSRVSMGLITEDSVCTEGGCVVSTELDLILKGEAGLQLGFELFNSTSMEDPVLIDLRVAAAGHLCTYTDQYETFPVLMKEVSYAKCTGSCDDIESLKDLRKGNLYFNHSIPYDSDWGCNGWCFSSGSGCTSGSCWCEPAPGAQAIKVKKLVKKVAIIRICLQISGIVKCISITEDKYSNIFTMFKLSEGDDFCPELIAEKPDGTILTGQMNHLGEFSRKFGAVQRVGGKLFYADNSKWYRDCHFGYERKIIFESCCLDTWFLLPTLNLISMHKRTLNNEIVYYKNSLSYVGSYKLTMKVPKFMVKRIGTSMEIDELKIQSCEGCSNCMTGASCKVQITSQGSGVLSLGMAECQLKHPRLQVEAGTKVYDIGYFCERAVTKTEMFTVNSKIRRSSSKETKLHDGESLTIGSQAVLVDSEKLSEQGCKGFFCWGGTNYTILEIFFWLIVLAVAVPLVHYTFKLFRPFYWFFWFDFKKMS